MEHETDILSKKTFLMGQINIQKLIGKTGLLTTQLHFAALTT